MPPVQPTPEYDLTVVPYRPRYFWLRVFFMLTFAVILIFGSYYSGYYRGIHTQETAIAERNELRKRDVESQEKILQFEQQIANLTLGSQVDRKAIKQVRARIVELKNHIAELTRDNTFYRDLMKPENSDQGISLVAPVIKPLVDDPQTDGQAYDYTIVVKQLATNRLQVVGHLEFVLSGQTADGKTGHYSLHQLSKKELSKRIKLNFRYFQRFEGKMVLPDGFTPKSIQIKIISLKPKKALIEKTFVWKIKESK